MNVKVILGAGSVLVGAGYVLGRVRPVQRLDEANWSRLMWGTGKRPRSQAAVLADVALFSVLHPRKSLDSYQRRNETPEPVASIGINPRFLAPRD